MGIGVNDGGLFEERVWRPALEKFGAVTHLTVTLYDARERVVCREAAAPGSLFGLFEEHRFTPGILLECARHCLAQTADRPAVVVAPAYGLGVVGTSLVLEGRVVAAAVAGYALVDFCQSTTIAALARHAGIPFRRLWALAQQQQPVPERRLLLHGELLQVLGDTILRENYRTREYERIAARLEAEAAVKDEFLAVLSHELRTPLTPILGWVRILEQAGDNPSTRTKAAESIKRNALLQIKLVDDLLDLNRAVRDKIALDLAVHDLAGLLHSALDTLTETAAQKHVGLELVEAAEPLSVEADAGRLQQVFVNVLSNAVKFTPPGGQVRLTVERQDGAAVVRIRDSGEGITPQFLPHVFEMFRQHEEGTLRRHSGLGIGLALVKRLVELHGGGVSVASDGAGRGTEVVIRLPLATQGAAAGRDRLKGRPFHDLSILVVEDTEDTLEATRLMLEFLGATVLLARNGREALEVLDGNKPDLVLCDLRMPEMDGFAFLRELSRRDGADHSPVVAMTGLAEARDRDRTRVAGFAGHLKKPFDDTAMVSIVRATLAQRPVA